MIECKYDHDNDGVRIKLQGTGKELLIELTLVISMIYEKMRKLGFPEEKVNSMLTSMVFSAVEEYNNKNNGGDEPNDASV